MSPNPAPFNARHLNIWKINTCNPQHPVANVIVDGSSPFTRSLTTADSKCQPLFILRMGRELGQIRVDCVGGSVCQFLTAVAYLRLTFGTISGPGAVFLAPNLALGSRRCAGRDSSIHRWFGDISCCRNLFGLDH